MIPAAAKKIAAARRLHGFWTQVNGNIDDHAVGQLHVFQEIKNAAAETRLNLSRLRFGANGFSLGSGRFSLGAGCFSFFRCRRTGDFPLRFVQRLVGERIGFAILLAINVLDAERIEGLGHFLSALEKRAQIFAFNFLLLGDDFPSPVADHHAVSSRSGVAARAAVNIRAMHRGSRLGLRRSVSEQIFSTGSWRAARHQEFVDAAEEVFAEPAAEFATGMGSRVYRMRPQLSQRKTSSLVSVASS